MGDSLEGRTDEVLSKNARFYDCIRSLDFLDDSNLDSIYVSRTSSSLQDNGFPKQQIVQNVPDTIAKISSDTTGNGLNEPEEDVSSCEEDEFEDPWELADRFLKLKSPMENVRLALSRTNPIPEARSDETCFRSFNASTGMNKTWPLDKPDIYFGSSSGRSSAGSSTSNYSHWLQQSSSCCANNPWSYVDIPITFPETQQQKSRKPSLDIDSLLSLSSNTCDRDTVFRNYTPDMSPLATSTPEKHPTSKERPSSHTEKFGFVFSNSYSTIPGYMRSVDNGNSSSKGSTSVTQDSSQQLSFKLDTLQPKEKNQGSLPQLSFKLDTLQSKEKINCKQSSIAKNSSSTQHKSINRQLFSPAQLNPKLEKSAQKSPARRKLFMTEDEEAVHYLVTKYLNDDSRY